MTILAIFCILYVSKSKKESLALPSFPRILFFLNLRCWIIVKKSKFSKRICIFFLIVIIVNCTNIGTFIQYLLNVLVGWLWSNVKIRIIFGKNRHGIFQSWKTVESRVPKNLENYWIWKKITVESRYIIYRKLTLVNNLHSPTVSFFMNFLNNFWRKDKLLSTRLRGNAHFLISFKIYVWKNRS